MTTYSEPGRIPLKAVLLLWLLALAGGATVALATVANEATLKTPVGRVQTGSHAMERHGSEAEAIRQCLQQQGPDMVWKKKDEEGVYIFCVNLDEERGCGRWGALFAEFFPSLAEGCDYKELTSFVPRDGTYHRVIDYLKTFAKRIK